MLASGRGVGGGGRGGSVGSTEPIRNLFPAGCPHVLKVSLSPPHMCVAQCSTAAPVPESSAVPEPRGPDRGAQGCPGQVHVTCPPPADPSLFWINSSDWLGYCGISWPGIAGAWFLVKVG